MHVTTIEDVWPLPARQAVVAAGERPLPGELTLAQFRERCRGKLLKFRLASGATRLLAPRDVQITESLSGGQGVMILLDLPLAEAETLRSAQVFVDDE